MTKKIFANFILAILSIFLCLSLIEIALRSGYFDNLDDAHPGWIPRKYRTIDGNINARNILNSKGNTFGFNDRERDVQKKEGVYRIAVLGDSFIWGDGLPYEITWNHKLEKKIVSRYGEEVEVLSWGKCGWSTLNEYDFFRQHGVKYGIDLLIVGYVTNDPDPGNLTQNYFRIERKNFIRKLFPNVMDFLKDNLENLVDNSLRDYGYADWENKLYTPQNLQKYSMVLRQFSNFCNDHGVRLLFVLTPPNYEEWVKTKFDKITPLLKAADIEYMDLYPVVARDLKKDKVRELWANKANPHPGDLVTEVIANEVLRFFNTNVETKAIRLNKVRLAN